MRRSELESKYLKNRTIVNSYRLSRNSFQALLMTFYLHTYVVVEKILTPNTFFFHLKNGKQDFDNKGHTKVVLMGLSKAFNTINHELLIAKGHGFSEDALKLIFSYMCDR